jgi:hypothetical protein
MEAQRQKEVRTGRSAVRYTPEILKAVASNLSQRSLCATGLHQTPFRVKTLDGARHVIQATLCT